MMRKASCLLAVVCLLAGTITLPALAATEEWEFSKVTRIKIDGVSGDVTLRPAKGSTGLVVLDSNVKPSENFRGEVEQQGKTLRIEEKFRGGSSSGNVDWTIYLPQNGSPIKISIDNASGDLDCYDVNVHLDFNTASGEIRLSRVELVGGSSFDTASGDYEFENLTITEDTRFSTASGDYILRNLEIGADCEFSTASGDIEITECKCAEGVKFSTASGDVLVEESELMGQADFSSASGDVSVYLKTIPDDDLSASSASGDVILDIEDFDGDCTLILIKRQDKGRISCPFEFDEEETFRDHHVYEKKTVHIGRGGPVLELRTASGKVKVKK
jgi:DUF4097 and DUF4098 domain-containing protein YvlB